MRHALFLLVFLSGFLSTAIAGEERDDWPQLGGGPDHNNFRDVKNRITFPKVLWHVRGPFGQPTIRSGKLYTGGKSLYCLDPKDGKILGEYGKAGGGSFASAPVLTGDKVIARHGAGEVIALAPDLKVELWKHSFEAKKVDHPFPGVLSEGLYIFTHRRHVTALHADTGKVAWAFDTPDGAFVNMTPAIVGKRVFFGSASGAFFSLDIHKGKPLWVRQGGGEYGWTDPVGAFGRVFVGDRGIRGRRMGAFNAFDMVTGKLEWSARFGGTGLSTPGVMPGYLIAGFLDTLRFFDAATGRVREDPLYRVGVNPFGSPTLVGNTVYFGCLDGRLYAFDSARPKRRWAFEVGENAKVSSFVYWKDRIFLYTSEGLFALGQETGNKTFSEGFILKWKG